MIGIDHKKASLAYRELFSFTKKKSMELLEQLKQNSVIQGCVLLSTCNRTEVWISCEEGKALSLYDMLCKIKGIDSDEYQEFFTEREGEEAVRHLYYLACGFRSRIIGEDQIITQVKEALSLARECDCTDKILEVLFRMAITAAKKVKTEVQIPKGNDSVIYQAIEKIQKDYQPLKDKKCLVIGNGEMGKRAALALAEYGADVTVTVRQYRSGMVQIPRGCRRIHYGERYELLFSCDLVVSATASPNYTLTYHEITSKTKECKKNKNPLILIDLAVPRDIEPKIKELPDIVLFDIDDFTIEEADEKLQAAIKTAEIILEEGIGEFISWYECKDMLPFINRIQMQAAEDLELRIEKKVKMLAVPDTERKCLQAEIEAAAKKVIGKLMFGLRDHVSSETFKECIEGIEQIYQDKKI